MVCAGALEPLKRYPESVARLVAEDGDESLDQFLTARLGPELARILGSSIAHGIYAADSRVLSIRAAFPSIWSLARNGRGSIVRGMLAPASSSVKIADNYELGDVQEIMKTASVYSFKEGMTTLVHALEKALADSSNVQIIRNDHVAAIDRSSDEGDLVVSSAPI